MENRFAGFLDLARQGGAKTVEFLDDVLPTVELRLNALMKTDGYQFIEQFVNEMKESIVELTTRSPAGGYAQLHELDADEIYLAVKDPRLFERLMAAREVTMEWERSGVDRDRFRLWAEAMLTPQCTRIRSRGEVCRAYVHPKWDAATYDPILECCPSHKSNQLEMNPFHPRILQSRKLKKEVREQLLAARGSS